MRRALWICLGLLFAVGSAPAEHRLEPDSLHLGETALYVVDLGRMESAAMLAATTVHAPRGEGLLVEPTWVRYRLEGGAYFREDAFRIRPTQAGEIALKPAVVEGPGQLPDRQEDMTLVVRPRRPPAEQRSMAFLGLLLLLPAALVLMRRRRRGVPGGDGPAGTGGEGVDPLAACKQARIRGDVRDFYVALYAALRAAVRAASGRSPRDPKGLARSGQDAGLSHQQADQLRNLATLCERVVFGGEDVEIRTINESYQRAEAILESLAGETSEKETEK